MSDLPIRFREAERRRQQDKEAKSKSPAGGATGVSEGTYEVEDVDEVTRVKIGQVSAGTYDLELYDATGALQWNTSMGGGGGGAPTTANYLVGTANAGLSAEIVVGTTPGGELGGTWASPTVDATHSGSAHDRLGFFNVKAYGAVGNNIADDTAAIQSALNAADANTGGTVFFPDGIYKLTASLTMPTRTRLLGIGRESLLVDSVGNMTILNVNGVSEGAIENLGFFGSGTLGTAGRAAIWCNAGGTYGARRTVIRNNWIHSVGTCGITLEGVEHSIIHGNIIEGCVEHGIYVSTGSKDLTISDNVIQKPGLGGASTVCGIKLAGTATRINMTGNVIDESLTEGVLFESGVTDCSLVGGSIFNSTQRGARINAGASGILIQGVQFTNNDIGSVRDFGGSKVVISGNRFNESVAECIRLNAGTDEVAILNNYFQDAVTTGYAVILGGGTNHFVTGNYFSDDITNAIEVVSGVTGVRIVNNYNRATGVPISDSGTGTVILDTSAGLALDGTADLLRLREQTPPAGNPPADRLYIYSDDDGSGQTRLWAKFDGGDIFRIAHENQPDLFDHAIAADPHTVYQKESEKDAANGYAGLNASTIVPAAKLGTGTADATKILRGDNTWVVPTGADHPDGDHDHNALTNLTTGDPHTQYPLKSILTTKGDIYVATGNSTPVRLPVGAFGQILRANAFETTGVQWVERTNLQDDHVVKSWAKDPGAATGSTYGMVAPTLTATASSVDSANGFWLNSATTASNGNPSGITSAFTQVRADHGSATVPVEFVAKVKTVDITLCRIWIGFFSASLDAVATPTTQHVAAFRFDTGVDGTNFWRCVTNNGTGPPTVTTTTIANTVDTARYFRIRLSTSQTDFWINGTSQAVHTTTLPGATTLMGYGVRITTLTTAAKNIRTGWIQIWQP